jgi:hypothetical protein
MFQIVHVEVGADGTVRRPLLPLYDLWEDAMALAEFDASRCMGEYGYDEEHECWYATDADRIYRFVVEPVPTPDQVAGRRTFGSY